MPTEKDPLISAWFALEFQGKIEGSFKECTGLGSESQVVEHKATGPKGEYVLKKLPGRMKWNDIVLKQGITDSMRMWQWRELCEQGKIAEARRNGSLVMFDSESKEVARWDFVNAWPSKLSGPVANAGNNEVGVEELTITHEGYKRVK